MNSDAKLQRLIDNLEAAAPPAIVGAGPRTAPVASDVWFERRIAGELEFDYLGPRGKREHASLPRTFVVPVVADGALTASIDPLRVRLGGVLFDTPALELPVGSLARASHIVIEFSEPTTLRAVPLLASGADPDARLSEPAPEWAAGARVKVSVALPLEQELPTPIVNVAPPEINVQPPEVRVDVHVPEQPAPIVAAAPLVTAVRVDVDRKGNKTYIPIREGNES